MVAYSMLDKYNNSFSGHSNSRASKFFDQTFPFLQFEVRTMKTEG